MVPPPFTNASSTSPLQSSSTPLQYSGTGSCAEQAARPSEVHARTPEQEPCSLVVSQGVARAEAMAWSEHAQTPLFEMH